MNCVNTENKDFNIKLSSPECVRELIQKTENGMYPTISEDGVNNINNVARKEVLF